MSNRYLLSLTLGLNLMLLAACGGQPIKPQSEALVDTNTQPNNPEVAPPSQSRSSIEQEFYCYGNGIISQKIAFDAAKLNYDRQALEKRFLLERKDPNIKADVGKTIDAILNEKSSDHIAFGYSRYLACADSAGLGRHSQDLEHCYRLSNIFISLSMMKQAGISETQAIAVWERQGPPDSSIFKAFIRKAANNIYQQESELEALKMATASFVSCKKDKL